MNFYSNMIKFADERTADVLSNKTFDQLLIHPEVINRIKKCNYQLPTPVQAGAIPLGLLGNDLLVQAKSGTGKTLVFATLVANAVMETRGTDVVAVIIAPVREIAYQIKDLIDQLTPSETRTCVFIGGEDVKDNKAEIAHGCSVAIGTPGRMGQLIRDGSLSFKQSKLFVLDEADKLMESTFTEDIKLIYNALNPETTQVTAFSATYPNDFDKYLSGFMKSPISFRIDSQDVQLLGIYQYAVVGLALRPVDIINKLLEEISYAQSVIFTNQSDKCVQVSDYLSEKRFKVAAISGNFTQEERKKVITDLKNFALRIMVSTDLTARGIDAPNVNLVFNVGVPATLETYLHRIGRAGRYGGNGASITLLTTQQDVANFVRMTAAGGLNVKYLDISTDIPYDLTYNGNFYSESFGFIDSCNKVVADVKADVARISEEREPSKVGLTEYSNNSLLKIRTNSVDEMQSFKAIVNNCENNDVIASPSPVNAVSQSNSLSVAPNGEIVPTPQLSANNVEQINPETNAVVEAQSSNSEVFAESPKESTSSNSFVIPARPDPWAEDHPRPRLSTDTATPLPIVNANIVRQIIPDFTQDLEADIAKAKEAAADVPPIPNVPVFPQPPRRGGYNQTGTGQETNGFNSSRGNSRGAPFGSSQGFASQDNSGFGSQRGNSFGGGRGGRGGFNQSSSGDGQDTSGFGSNRGRGGRRGGFGGDFAGNNQDSSGFGSSSRGSFGGGGRGGFNQSSFGDGQDNSGGFGSSARGSFGTSGRGGFNQSSSTDGQGFTSNRGGRGARGAFSSFGDGQDNSGYGSGRGDGSFGGRGSRGGFGTSGRGGFNQSSSAEGQDASGFGSQRGRGGRGGFSQSSFGDAQDNSGGFGSSARGGRGAFSGNIDNSGGFGSSARGGRGAFSGNTQESSAFPSRGGFGQNDGNQEANENVLVPGRRFQSNSTDPLPSASMAEKMAALKNKSFGKTIESGAFSQKPFAPVMIHAAGLSKVETSGSDNIECLESSEDSIENLTTNVEKLTVESADESCIAYSSQEMLSVRDSKTSEDWAVYAKMKSEWDTKNSPFEFDSELRISFELQLRVLRARETESLRQRQEMLGILKPKTAMVKEEIKTVFPSSVMGCSAITTSNKDDCPDLETFFKRLNDFCKNFKDEKHVGPAVFARPSSGQTSNIFEIAKRLDAEFASKEKT